MLGIDKTSQGNALDYPKLYKETTLGKLVAIASRCRGVYNATGVQSETFREKGEARECLDDFLKRKSFYSVLCFDARRVASFIHSKKA